MSRALVPKIRILIGAVVAIGPGRADLLGAIARTGSISAAAREMKMSYRRAWLLVEAMNSAFRRPLVETLTGGESGGGARGTRIGGGGPCPPRPLGYRAAGPAWARAQRRLPALPALGRR